MTDLFNRHDLLSTADSLTAMQGRLSPSNQGAILPNFALSPPFPIPVSPLPPPRSPSLPFPPFLPAAKRPL